MEATNIPQTTSVCCNCGYTWTTGHDGSHSCIDRLQGKIRELFLIANESFSWIAQDFGDEDEIKADKLTYLKNRLWRVMVDN